MDNNYDVNDDDDDDGDVNYDDDDDDDDDEQMCTQNPPQQFDPSFALTGLCLTATPSLHAYHRHDDDDDDDHDDDDDNAADDDEDYDVAVDVAHEQSFQLHLFIFSNVLFHCLIHSPKYA